MHWLFSSGWNWLISPDSEWSFLPDANTFKHTEKTYASLSLSTEQITEGLFKETRRKNIKRAWLRKYTFSVLYC